MSPATRVIAGLVAGLAVGALIARLGDADLVRAASAIEPVGTLWINAIRMTVIPLVVSTLIVGIATTSGAGVIGRIGWRAIALFLTLLVATATVSALIANLVFRNVALDESATRSLRDGVAASSTTIAEQAARVPTATQWLVDLVPINPVKAAADGAMLPLIVFTLAFGIALTRVTPASRESAIRFFAAISDTMLVLVRWILVLAPIGVFALAVPLAVKLGLSAARVLGAYILTVNVLLFLVMAALYPLASVIGRVSLRSFAKATLPAQAVAFSSRSSLAALPTMLESAERILRLPTAIRTFFLPLAASVFRLGGAVGITVGVLFIAKLYGAVVSTPMLATIVVMSVLTTFSIPGVPGGSIVALVPVLAAANLPVHGIGVLLAVDAATDPFRTTTNVSGSLAVATMLAGVAPDEDAPIVQPAGTPEELTTPA